MVPRNLDKPLEPLPHEQNNNGIAFRIKGLYTSDAAVYFDQLYLWIEYQHKYDL